MAGSIGGYLVNPQVPAINYGSVGNTSIGSGAVQSGNIASGQVGTYAFGSGATATRAMGLSPIYSGSFLTVVTEETVSGVRAVHISPSGNVRIAMAAVSGRMPAIGAVFENVLSGIQCNVYIGGAIQVA